MLVYRKSARANARTHAHTNTHTHKVSKVCHFTRGSFLRRLSLQQHLPGKYETPYCFHCPQGYRQSVRNIFVYCSTFMTKRAIQMQNSYRTLLLYIWNFFLCVLYELKQNALCEGTFFSLSVRASVCEMATVAKSFVGF